MTNCTTCNIELTSKFCPNFGQPSQLKRIDGNYIIHEIEHVLHIERGILYTIRERKQALLGVSIRLGQFYEKGKVVNYVKAFFAYILGMHTFSLAAIIIGISTDIIFKH